MRMIVQDESTDAKIRKEKNFIEWIKITNQSGTRTNENFLLLFLYFLPIEQGIKYSEQNTFHEGSCPIDVSREEDINKYIDSSK